MNTKVLNNTARAIGVAGVTIPAGQQRFVRGIEGADLEKLQARVKAGELSAPGIEPKRRTRRKKPVVVEPTIETPEEPKEGES